MVGAIRIAEMAEKVLFPQMPEQFVSVEKSLIAILAQRMPSMRLIVRIAFPPVLRQLFSRVRTSLEREDPQVLHANIAIE